MHQNRIKYSKRSLAHGSSFGPSQDGEEDFQDLSQVFVSFKILYFRKNIKDRLVVDCSSSFTHTQNISKYFKFNSFSF